MFEALLGLVRDYAALGVTVAFIAAILVGIVYARSAIGFPWDPLPRDAQRVVYVNDELANYRLVGKPRRRLIGAKTMEYWRTLAEARRPSARKRMLEGAALILIGIFAGGTFVVGRGYSEPVDLLVVGIAVSVSAFAAGFFSCLFWAFGGARHGA